MNELLNNYIDKMKNQIINSTCEIINIPSVFSNSDGSNTPFGKHTVEALNYILNLGENFGFRTKNIDNMCGYIEFGEGEKLLGIIGHLDVVPAENDWIYSPFNATIDNGNIYGRGAIDDKGPVIACLYAMKAVADNYNLEPEAIGGGTYARAFYNCISFGPKMPLDKDMCHQTDEFISIDNLIFCTKVYSKAILDL